MGTNERRKKEPSSDINVNPSANNPKSSSGNYLLSTLLSLFAHTPPILNSIAQGSTDHKPLRSASLFLSLFPFLLSPFFIFRSLPLCFRRRGQEPRWLLEVGCPVFPRALIISISHFSKSFFLSVVIAAYRALGLLTYLFSAKPTSQIIPIRSVAAISSSSRKDASSLQPHSAAGPQSVAKTLPKNVPLASQEPTKGVVQYALYVYLWFLEITAPYDFFFASPFLLPLFLSSYPRPI